MPVGREINRSCSWDILENYQRVGNIRGPVELRNGQKPGLHVERLISRKMIYHPLEGEVRNRHLHKSALKRIFIRCYSHGYSAKIHSLKLCSHVGFCVRDGHIPSLARGVCRNYSSRYGLYRGLSRSRAVTIRVVAFSTTGRPSNSNVKRNRKTFYLYLRNLN